MTLIEKLKAELAFDDRPGLICQLIAAQSEVARAQYDGAREENARLSELHGEWLKFTERMHQLGQAMPPNAVSMEIQRALSKLESYLEKREG